MTSFAPQLEVLLSPDVDPVAAGWQLRQLAESASDHGPELLRDLAHHAQHLAGADPAVIGGILRAIHHVTLLAGTRVAAELDLEHLQTVEAALPDQVANRHLLLQLLAIVRTDASLRFLVNRMVAKPPLAWMEVGQVLSPLMQHNDWPVSAVYPELLGGIQHPSLASPVLDLANYLFRKRRIDVHPAHDRSATLATLLGEVTDRLAQFEENPRSFGDDVDTVQTRLGEAVALAVSLCDSVGLLGDPDAIAKLNRTIELKHRRVQCEAAGALARLGEASGRERLVALAAEPAARLRAIFYADELGFGDQINTRYRGDQSTAEAEMALWLNQPQQMGVPPTGIQVVDRRRLLWPSFVDPVDVFLVRFEYNFGDQIYSNVGITGPVAFAMSTDVADLPMDDIYAIYAGWHADHPEIFTVARDQLNEAQVRVMKSFQDHLSYNGYESIQPQLLGIFLDEKAGVFSAQRQSKACIVVTDGLETMDQPTTGRSRPMTAADLFNLYKGRKMLRTFNA